MPKQKTEFDAICFGSIDKEKKESCHHCDYSDECEEYKPRLADLISSTKGKAKSDYIKEKAEETSTAIGQLFGYGLTIVILILVFWQASKDL